MEKEIEEYFNKVNPLNLGEKEKILSIEKIGRGESNVNFLVATSKNKYLMRFSLIDNTKRFRQEYEILKRIEHLTISPKPLLIDVSKKHFKESFMIQSFIEGKSLDKLNKKEYIPYYKKLAKDLSKLHKQKITLDNKTTSFEKRLVRASKVVNELKRELVQFPKRKTILKLIKIYEDTLKSKLQHYQPKLAFCHGDVCLGNVMFKDKEFFLIDWEGAGNLDPAIEISYHLFEFPYTNRQRAAFVEEYLKERKDAGLNKRMKFSNFFIACTGYLEILNTCFNIVNKKGHKEFLKSADLKEYWDWGNYYLRFVIDLKLFNHNFEKSLKRDLKSTYMQISKS